MEIVYRKLSELKPNPKNPRKSTEEAIEKLAESIKGNPKFFEARPILLSDRTGSFVIIGGERRSEAAALLKMEAVPTILLSGLTEEEEDEILIKDNTHAGVWDETKLAQWDKGQLQGWGVVADWKKTSGEKYTRKIESPVYEPKGEKPVITELYDDSKYRELLEGIEKAKISAEAKQFLKLAATRHIIFNFEKIAEYYAQAGAKEQRLFEDSALVIIDFQSAIGGGYVKMCESLIERYKIEHDD